MTIEEKAKAYDEALERARKCWGEYNDIVGAYENKGVCEEIFPELKESEDERIRNWLINTLKSLNNTAVQIDGAYEMMLPAIAWLEKQGEQKPADKIEPTPIFKIGDILKRKGKDYTFRVDRIQGGYYHCDRNHGAFFPIEEQGNWELVEQKAAWSEEDENLFRCAIDAVREEAKVRTDGCLDEEVGEMVTNWLKSLKNRVQSKQEWSEEDRSHIEKLILNVNAKEFPDEVDWLISLHEKIAPPYWDKEDEKMLNQAIQEVEYALNDKDIAFSGKEPVLLWLKHLRPQSQWKPSEEQIDLLRDVASGAKDPVAYGATMGVIIKELEQLKAL